MSTGIADGRKAVARGTNGLECDDCCMRWKCGCRRCVPLILKVKFVLDAEPSAYNGCCNVAFTTIAWDCTVQDSENEAAEPTPDRYVGGNLGCGQNVDHIVSGQPGRNEAGECVLVLTLEHPDETVTVEGPADSPFGFEVSATLGGESGTLTVTPLEGFRNLGRFRDLDECPDCLPIRMIKFNPLPETNAVIPGRGNAPKTGARLGVKGEEVSQFASPCTCIPDELCLRYSFSGKCGGEDFVVRLAYDCGINGYQTSFTVQGDKNGPEERQITYVPTIDDCSYTLSISGTSIDATIINPLTRMEHASLDTWEKWTKVCDLTIEFTTIRDELVGETFYNESVEINFSDNCEAPPSNCYGACPELDFEDVEEYETCPDTPVYGAVIGDDCDFDGTEFQMRFNSAQTPVGEAGPYTVNIPDPDCQQHLSYSPDFETFPSEIVAHAGTVYLPGCTYGLPDTGDDAFLIAEFALTYLALECQPTGPVPSRYRLDYWVQHVCGTEVATASGHVFPSVASCSPFRLDYNVPIEVATPCECCTGFTIRLTL